MFEQIYISDIQMYTNLNIFCIILLFITLYKVLFTSNILLCRNLFAITIGASILLSLIDIIRANTSIFANISESLYFLCITFIGYLLFLHFGLMIGDEKISKPVNRIVFCVPFIAIAVINIFISSYVIRLVFSSVYIFMSVIYITDLAKYVLKENRYYVDRFQFILYPLIAFIGGLFHLLDNNIPIICGITIAVLLMHVNLVELLVSIDTLTDINNRSRLISYIDKKIKCGSKDFYIMMIDADKFKQINDKYGHTEGDAALIRISKAIKSSCASLPSRAFLCRYGGDEFIIAVQTDLDTIEKLKEDIYINLYQLNELENAPYTLDVSIGIAKYDPAIHLTPKDIIDDADDTLYKNKFDKRK